MSTHPTEAWVGKWISVSGLIEPPYQGRLHGSYRHVGITVTAENQIIHITEHDAKFRLGRAPQRSSETTHRDKPSNEEILDGLRTGRTRTKTTPGAGRTKATSASVTLQTATARNAQILKGLQQPGAQGAVQGHSTPAPTHGSSPGLLSRIPAWVWIGGVVVLLLYLFAQLPTQRSSYQSSIPGAGSPHPPNIPVSELPKSNPQGSDLSKSITPPASPEPNAFSDHGPGRVACDVQWSALHRNDLGYREFMVNCMKNRIQ